MDNMTMPDYITQDRLQELSRQIDQMHYSYLETDDSPQKIEQRRKLEGYIREYLCLVPHSRKFILRETSDVLHRSAASLEDFSGYRAALAWNAIGQYAANLLMQPWRKEYREIKMYSGFYKHEIEANLVGAELMFEAMGYKHSGQSTLILEGPICPDQVAHVSRDSLVAFVECQLLKTIWEGVSTLWAIQWLEVLRFRELHVGGPDHACRALTYRHNERNYQEEQRHLTNVYQHPGMEQQIYQQQANYNTNSNHIISPTMNIPHNHIDSSSSGCLYGQIQTPVMPGPVAGNPLAYYSGYSTYAPIPSPAGLPAYGMAGVPTMRYPQMAPYTIPYQMNHSKQNAMVNNPGAYQHNNGYHYPLQVALPPNMNGFGVAHLNAYGTVPTGQLIELDGPNQQEMSTNMYNHHRHEYSKNVDDVDGPIHSKLNDNYNNKRESNHINTKTIDKRRGSERNVQHANINNNNVDVMKPGKEVNVDSLENWDYVFKNLEKKGYNKDLGERENVLDRDMKRNRQNILQLEHEFQMINVQDIKHNDKINKINDNLEQHSSNENITQIKTNNSDRQKTNTRLKVDKKNVNKPEEKTLKKSNNPITKSVENISIIKKPAVKELKTKTIGNSNGPLAPQTSTTLIQNTLPVHWQCGACTYNNTFMPDICEMCGKSRVVGPEAKPLASGGKECHQCTLVNDRGASTCNACGGSLQDSPTYI